MADPNGTLHIGKTPVGTAHRPFVIAEMSANHNGDLQRALDIVRAAADAGAQALKVQTYTADTMTVNVDHPRFRISSGHELWGDRHLYDLYQEAHLPWEWHEEIFALGNSLGLEVFSAPFDPTAVAFLDKLGAPAFKVASSEVVDLPLIRAMAETGKPLIISTGMASVQEIAAAVDAARQTGNEQLVVLSCTASYPAPLEASNLRGIPTMRAAFGTQIGLSDHTMGIGAAVAAVAFGATVIEKHFTLRRADGGVDAEFSLEPAELRMLVAETEAARLALGQDRIGATEAEREGLRFRRSLFVVEDVRAGDVVSAANVRSIRPAGGLAPDEFARVDGRQFRVDTAKGTPLSWDLL
jgi:pseudaminic acid synthase